MESTETSVVYFVKSPSGAYKLGYSIGDFAPVPTAQAQELIKSGYAITEAAGKEVEQKKEEKAKAAKQSSEVILAKKQLIRVELDLKEATQKVKSLKAQGKHFKGIIANAE